MSGIRKKARQLSRTRDRLSHTAWHYARAAVNESIDKRGLAHLRSLGREAYAKLRRTDDELRSIELQLESEQGE